MGIEKFRRIFHRRPFKEAENVELPEKIDSLLIDCNGILHRAKNDVFPVIEKHGEEVVLKKKYSSKGLKEEYLSRIIERLEELMDRFRPKSVC